MCVIKTRIVFKCSKCINYLAIVVLSPMRFVHEREQVHTYTHTYIHTYIGVVL